MSTGTAIRNHRQRGFTLAEILVTTAIFAIIMIAALTVYDRSNRVFKQSTEAADLQQSTRIGFEKLVSDLRMAGFDYNRGGVPSGDGQWPQPDEQIEYAGPTSVVFRANFNYNVASSTGNGLELNYEPKNVNGAPIFPYVTTSNDEIIAYVLRSNDSSKNTGSIKFWVDDYLPRAAFPSTISPGPKAGNPSRPEEKITISNIDTTNANPPYTLYRMTLSDVKAGNLGTPVAENIRSLKFYYYTDASGKTLLTNPNNSAIDNGRDAGAAASPGGNFTATGTGAIGGDGQYDPDHVGTTTNYADRAQRALIASIRVGLVGMNSQPDGKYVQPNESIASIQNYRQYALESLVVPRNLGLTGFPEPAYNPPAPPTIVGMCVGYCGAPVVYWEPPASAGDVTKYRVEWDTVQTGAYTNGMDITDPTARSVVVQDDGVSDVSQLRWYRMWSYNDNGRSLVSSNLWSATAKNATKPGPISNPTVGNDQLNQIPLSWYTPDKNVDPKKTLSCTGVGGSTDGEPIPSAEIISYRVYRSTHANFNPADSSESFMVLDTTSKGQPPLATPGALVQWIDTALNNASDAPPANCISYYYRIQVLDRCYKQNSWNASNDATDSMSAVYPPVGQQALGPREALSSNSAAAVPTQITVDKTTPKASGCPDPDNLTSKNCKITLQWPKVITDTVTPTPNPIGVEYYVLTRGYRLQSVGGSFTPDPGFGSNGQREINCSLGTCANGYSQDLPINLATFVDRPPMADANGNSLEYQYRVAARNCALYSGVSPNSIAEAGKDPNPTVIYPGCTINPSIVECGAQGMNCNLATGGDTPQTPWIFGAGDTVTVTPPNGVTTQDVTFQLQTLQGQNIGSAIVDNTSPYVYTWSNQTDGTTYILRITITIKSGTGTCSEVHIKYIQDESPAGCAFTNQATAPALGFSVPNNVQQNNAKVIVSETFTITNTSTVEALNLSSQNSQLTWQLPSGDTLHSDMKLTSVAWGNNQVDYALTVPASSTNTNLAVPANVTVPKAVTNANGTVTNGTLTVTFTWQYDVNDDCATHACTNSSNGNNAHPYDPSLQDKSTPIQKLCIAYQVASETGVIKHCNLFGQSNSTSNPTNCD
jgi:prepilin-type N-terminal cleavage/methylation domain-containing protein